PAALLEKRLESRDGRIVGQPDVLDVSSETVVDYKTGSARTALDGVSEAEERQLRIYAFLARENGMEVSRGGIVRADHQRIEVEIPPDDALEAAEDAIRVLEAYNRKAGMSFEAAASPSEENCRHCPCIPFCEAFWSTAGPGWLE